jgi:hypothetical protein
LDDLDRFDFKLYLNCPIRVEIIIGTWNTNSSNDIITISRPESKSLSNSFIYNEWHFSWNIVPLSNYSIIRPSSIDGFWLPFIGIVNPHLLNEAVFVLTISADIRNARHWSKSSNDIITISRPENESLQNSFIYNEWRFSWNIVTLSITEGNFINSPFILCLEQHFSYYCNISVGWINGTTKNTGWPRPLRFEILP